jgi:hypothetical protein
MNPTRAVVILACLLAIGCSPKAENMPVVHFGQWEIGEVKTCLRANCDNFLFCDIETYDSRIENNQSERNVFDKQLYSNAPQMTPQDLERLDQEAKDIESVATHGKTFAVSFRGSGIPQTDANDEHNFETDAKERLAAKRITKWVATLELARAHYFNNATRWTCRKTVDGISCE